jgi:hypothetical protein
MTGDQINGIVNLLLGIGFAIWLILSPEARSVFKEMLGIGKHE